MWIMCIEKSCLPVFVHTVPNWIRRHIISCICCAQIRISTWSSLSMPGGNWLISAVMTAGWNMFYLSSPCPPMTLTSVPTVWFTLCPTNAWPVTRPSRQQIDAHARIQYMSRSEVVSFKSHDSFWYCNLQSVWRHISINLHEFIQILNWLFHMTYNAFSSIQFQLITNSCQIKQSNVTIEDSLRLIFIAFCNCLMRCPILHTLDWVGLVPETDLS